MLVAESPPSMVEATVHTKPGLLTRFFKSIPLPRGAQWYLVAYRWVLVVASVYTVVITWNVWQDRSDPHWHAWSTATPISQSGWVHRPTDAQLAPMLPVWDWLPQFDVGWLLVGSIVLILIRPRVGLALSAAIMVIGVLMDRSRLQPHYVLWFLMLATLPGVNAQLIGRANLISLWFWAGFHKLIIDFIKPDSLPGFTTDVIPNDLNKFFPPDKYHWNTHNVGVAMGFVIAATEMLVGLLCFIPPGRPIARMLSFGSPKLWRMMRIIPPARWIVAIAALFMHLTIIVWNCWVWHCNLLGWNFSLALAGFVLILPWRDGPIASLRKCSVWAGVAAVFLLLYPATYYFNGASAYLSYCVYVPNSPVAELRRPGEEHKNILFMNYDVVNFPLPPGQSIAEAYFEKIRKPGDELVITDPRPWARQNGVSKRRLTDDGEFRDDQPYGHWRQRNPDGKILSEGDILNGKESGHWTYFYPDGKKAMEGEFVEGKSEGVWKMWTPEGEETQIEYHDGEMVTPER